MIYSLKNIKGLLEGIKNSKDDMCLLLFVKKEGQEDVSIQVGCIKKGVGDSFRNCINVFNLKI